MALAALAVLAAGAARLALGGRHAGDVLLGVGTVVAAAVLVAGRRRDGARPAPDPTPGRGRWAAMPPGRTTPLPLAREPGRPSAEGTASGADPLLVDPDVSVHALLAGVRELAGAEDVVFWRWTDDDEASLVAAAHAGARDPRSEVPDPATSALIAWVAEQRVFSSTGDGDALRLAAVPVTAGDRVLGALGVSGGGLRVGRAALKEWLPRAAGQLGALATIAELQLALRAAVRRQTAQLRAVDEIRGAGSLSELAWRVCRHAMELTGAAEAAVIAWERDGETGRVIGATERHRLTVGAAVPAASLVGAACGAGELQLWSDARRLEAGSYGSSGRHGDLPGSLAVVPILRAKQDVRGAIVLEGGAPGALEATELRALEILASIVASPLEAFLQAVRQAEIARTDELTGLVNRRTFDERLPGLLAAAARHEEPLSLVLVDVDHFKRVNDVHGHAVGDVVLRHVARVLGAGVREVDVCARYGGEEIAILLPRTPIAVAAEVAERLRRAIEARPVAVRGAEIPVTASFGIASYQETVAVADGLFAAADRALYQAKAAGRNQVTCHRPSVRQSAT